MFQTFHLLTGQSAVESCVELLGYCCCDANSVKVLNKAGLMDTLKTFREYAGDDFKAKVSDVYGKVSKFSSACRGEICEEKSAVGLVGMMASNEPKSIASSSECLVAAIYQWSGNDYEWFIRRGGPMEKVGGFSVSMFGS